MTSPVSSEERSDNLSRLLDVAGKLDRAVPLAGMINPDAATCRYAAEELRLRRGQVEQMRAVLLVAKTALEAAYGPDFDSVRACTKALSGDSSALLETSPNERRETGWLVEGTGRTGATRYRAMDKNGIHWTSDPNGAIRFARRADAEMFAADDDDAWSIIEHQWVTIEGDSKHCGLSAQETSERPLTLGKLIVETAQGDVKERKLTTEEMQQVREGIAQKTSTESDDDECYESH